MPAANTDLLRKTRQRFSTTLSSGVGAADATLPCASLAGVPTDTAIDVVLNRVDGNGTVQQTWETVTAVVSGSNLTSALRGVEGTASAWGAGTVVEILWTAAQWNAAVDALLTEHDQDGTHGAVTATTVTAAGNIETLGGAVVTDMVLGKTLNAGVTIDSLKIKDGGARLAGNTALKGRNNANSADIEIAKVNTSDQVVLGPNAVRPTRFVPVSDPGAWHYDSGVGAAKTSYTDVDVSSVVSARAFAVAYRLLWQQNNSTFRVLYVQQNGEGDEEYDRNAHESYAADQATGGSGVVELDANKVFEYKQNSAGGTNNACRYRFQVVGYFEYID